MLVYDELPNGKKLHWSHSQEDFVTAVLALGGQLPEVDELGERMLNLVDLDPSPFPDLRSMRLALQHGCDVATHLTRYWRRANNALTFFGTCAARKKKVEFLLVPFAGLVVI